MNESPIKEAGLFKGVMLAYFILILHVLLIAGVGLLIIFFRGVVAYLPYILLIGFAAIFGSGYYIYRRLKAQGRGLRDAMNAPEFRGKSLEISFMGGLASLKVGDNSATTVKAIGPPVNPLQIEDKESVRLRELTELARLLEKDLITPDEYNRVKRNLFSS